MGDVVTLTGRRRCHAERQTRGAGSGVVRAFPGARLLRMVNNVADIMATLDDVKAEEFLIFHFEVEERRLIEQGVAEPEIDRYIFETARAIWARARDIKAGVA